MSTIANQIEAYIKRLLAASENGVLELKRSDLAEIFMCVPSQINYVLSTRFSSSQGYLIESRRGGGGYVRIIKLGKDGGNDLIALLNNAKGQRVSRQAGEKLIQRLTEEEFISQREAMMLLALTDDNVLKESGDPERLRGDLLNHLLLLLLRDDFS
ncbi:MAG: CtsR family transcriptional regulator [Firmicutes bacterium]|nr:CtsR family transcriptional regulator [Bacillota bacterium]